MLKKVFFYSISALIAVAMLMVLYVTFYKGADSKNFSAIPPSTTVVRGNTTTSPTQVNGEQEASREFPWSATITLAVLAIGALIPLSDKIKSDRFREFKSEMLVLVGGIHEEVQKVDIKVGSIQREQQILKILNEEKVDRASIITRIKGIEADILNGFVEEDQLRAFIIGVSTRTQDFARDIASYHFTEEDYLKAKFQLVGKMSDCKMHGEHLGFSKELLINIDKIRCSCANALKGELKRLAVDKITNRKLARFREIIAVYTKSYCFGIVKAYNIDKIKNGGKNEDKLHEVG